MAPPMWLTSSLFSCRPILKELIMNVDSPRLVVKSTSAALTRRLCSKPRRVSRMFQPSYVLPKGMRQENVSCKSQRLMMENGLIRQTASGTFHLLPLAQRAVDKLVRIVEDEMSKIGAQKMTMPSLSASAPWRKSGRWDEMGSELFKLRDRHGSEMCLSPTHEEAVTGIISSEGIISHRRLPIKLFQISTKYRDEPRPRFGLLRGREFIMKDLYTFDESGAKAMDTYGAVCDAYRKLFCRLGLDCLQGNTGSIGGSLSHEYHVTAETGEDEIYHCQRCGFGANVETTGGSRPPCAEKLSESDCGLRLRRGIEVGHAFLLGTKYSEIFNAAHSGTGSDKRLIEMGCYGLGLTRILAASVEVLSTEEEMRWPTVLAPYLVYIVPPKLKSNEEAAIPLAETLFNDIASGIPLLRGEVLLDDRDHLTIGRRVIEAKKLGYPYIIVVAKRALEQEPHYEIINTSRGTKEYVTRTVLFQILETVYQSSPGTHS